MILEGAVTIKTSKEDVVYCGDKDVEPDAAFVGSGWLRVEDAKLKPGADTVSIRALTPSERSKYRDYVAKHGEPTGNHFACSRGVIRVNGKAKGATEWVDALAQQNAAALDLLGERINYLSAGQPMSLYHRKVRERCGVPEPEEVAEGAATKSPGPAPLRARGGAQRGRARGVQAGV